MMCVKKLVHVDTLETIRESPETTNDLRGRLRGNLGAPPFHPRKLPSFLGFGTYLKYRDFLYSCKIALVPRSQTGFLFVHQLWTFSLSSPNMSSIEGCVYTITGAASGIGQAVAIRLAELGAAGLALSDVNMRGLEATKEKCNYTFLAGKT